MNMISTGAFQHEVDASNKQTTIAEKFAAVWEKKNAKAARAGGVSLMALSLAACGSDSTTTTTTTTAVDTTTTTTTTVDANTNSALTTGIDALTGGSGSDTVSGSQTTLNAGDSFSGGTGADLLAVFTSAAATIGGFTTTGVETISASATGGALTMNMGNVSGETTVRVTGSDQNVTFSNSDNIATLELQYNSAGNATVTYNATTVVGTADSMGLSLTDTTNGTVTLAGIETLNVSNSGTSTVATLTTTSATTVNLTGSGTVTLTDVDDATTTLDASAYTGTSTMGGFGASAAVTITGGTGADTINMTGLTLADTIDGGAGADTLALTFDSNAVVTSTVAGDVAVSNVETLSLTSDTNSDAVDFDAFSAPAFDKVLVTITADADDVTLTDTQSSTFHLRNTNNVSVSDNVDFLTIDLKDSSGTADTIALTLQNRDLDETMTITTLTGAGIENINITADVASLTGGASAVAGDITVTNFTYAASEAITVTGDADFTISSTLAAGVVTYDASTATGDQAVTFGAANMTVTGGSGADTLNFAATLNGSDVIDGGAGIDTVTAVNVNDGAAYDVDLQLTNVERLTLTENESSDSALTVDLNGTSLDRITVTADHTSANAQKIEDVGGADIDLYLLGVGSGAGSVELDLAVDGAADNVDVFLTPTANSFVGTLTLNDAETIVIDVASGAGEKAQTIADIDASDATSVVFTSDDTWDDGDILAITLNSIKTGATIDFSGYNTQIGNAASLVDVAGTDGAANTVGKVADAATAMGTDGFTAVATGSYTILLGDGRTENADVETTINLGASNTGADTIRFVSSAADTTNDIGVVVIDNFNTAAASTATHRSVIDLSAFTGVETIADVTITAGELDDAEDVAIITATTATDFAGSITLLGITATTLAAADFVF